MRHRLQRGGTDRACAGLLAGRGGFITKWVDDLRMCPELLQTQKEETESNVSIECVHSSQDTVGRQWAPPAIAQEQV